MKPFTLTKPYLLSHKYTLATYITIILATTAITIISPYIIGDFLDILVGGGDIGAILRFCIIFGGLNILKIIIGYITTIMYTKITAKMSHDLNMDTIKHVQGLSLSYINQKDSAYLSQRLGTDAGNMIVFSISLVQSILTNVVMLIVPFAILLTMNWFVVVLMVSFLAVYTALYFAFKKSLYNAGFAFREAQAKFFSKLHEQLKYIKTIKTNAIQPQINARAENSFIDYRDTGIHNQKVNYLYTGLDGFISTLAQIALFVVGGIQLLAGNFTIGMFTIFTSYFGMMLGASRYFFGLGASYQNVMVSYNRIKEVFEHKLESRGAEVIKDISKIELRGLGFTYATEGIIKDFNAEFEKGNIYAIVGANGAGKSTLISLLMGLYIDEYDGRITYDDADIRSIDMTAARQNLIGFAEQEPLLIADSIKYNLDYIDKGGCNLSTLEKYINLLNMKDFASERTLDFVINEKNTNTSGGEKQKISILKVLYKDPAVMIFDEPTSALDAQTAQCFIGYLQQIKKNKIVIIITHDEVVKGCCDRIIKIAKT